MTFSICVREPYEFQPATDEGGADEPAADTEADREPATHYRFGVAVTTRLPAVGVLCPFASEDGAVATQSYVNVNLGRKGIEYLDDGLGVDDALEGLLNADDEAPSRQLHGVDHEVTFTFSGDECNPWYGHTAGENYTVAGNLLTGESVVAETAAAYEDLAVRGERDGSAGEASDHDPLALRLVEALAAGQAEGGDKREELTVQSAAVVVATTEIAEPEDKPLYSDLRVDATETPVADLRETVETAIEAQRTLEERAEAAEDEPSAEESRENDAADAGTTADG